MEGVFIAHYFQTRGECGGSGGLPGCWLLWCRGSRRDVGEVSQRHTASCVVNKMFQQRPREHGGNSGRVLLPRPARTLIGWRRSTTARCRVSVHACCPKARGGESDFSRSRCFVVVPSDNLWANKVLLIQRDTRSFDSPEVPVARLRQRG